MTSNPTPRAVIRPDEDVIDVIGHFGVVPLTFAEAREVADSITAHLATWEATSPAEPELIGSAVYRTARKPWDCECPGGSQPCPHPDCKGRIEPGKRHVEYLGEAPAYRSGNRYCLVCGIATWAASEWVGR